jgi:hypothetical protein
MVLLTSMGGTLFLNRYIVHLSAWTVVSVRGGKESGNGSAESSLSSPYFYNCFPNRTATVFVLVHQFHLGFSISYFLLCIPVINGVSHQKFKKNEAHFSVRVFCACIILLFLSYKLQSTLKPAQVFWLCSC